MLAFLFCLQEVSECFGNIIKCVNQVKSQTPRVARGWGGKGGGKGGEMTQTLYAHMNNKKKTVKPHSQWTGASQ
jgi:hypothetical protein